MRVYYFLYIIRYEKVIYFQLWEVMVSNKGQYFPI